MPQIRRPHPMRSARLRCVRFAKAAGAFTLGFGVLMQTASAEEPAAATYEPFPSGYDYPVESASLNRWVAEGQWTRIRQHAWNLFLGMRGTTPTSPQVWETWFSLPATFTRQTGQDDKTAEPAAGAPDKPQPMRHRTLHNRHVAASGSHGISGAPQYPSDCHFAGKEFLNNGDIMIAGVYYNKEAYEFVRSNNYYQTETIQALRASGKKSITEFPAPSFSIKHMYWPVRGDGLTALPVSPRYNPAPDPVHPGRAVIPQNPAVYNGYETWTDGVAIAPSASIHKAAGKTASVELYIPDPNYPVSFPKAQVVPLDLFYHRKIESEEWQNMNPVDRCILNQAAKWAYNREFQPDDYIASVAMHIVTKEFKPWTMQTFWWSSEPNFGRYAKDRPAHHPGEVWANYMMCTAYDMEKPVEGDGSPAVCSNPYIELVIPETDRSVTNCQNCHTRGAFPAAKVLTDVITQDAHYNAERRGIIKFDDPIFDGLIQTDFSWSIPLSTTPHPSQ